MTTLIVVTPFCAGYALAVGPVLVRIERWIAEGRMGR